MLKYVYILIICSALVASQDVFAAGAPRITFEEAVDPQRPAIESLVEREVSFDEFPDRQHGYFPGEWTDSDGDGVVNSNDACWETPLGDIVDSCGCPVPVHLKPKCASFHSWCFANPTLRYDAVYFAFDSYALDSAALRTLQRFTTTLLQDRKARVRITGHADRYGTDDYNFKLSEDRVNAVHTMLQTLGIDPSRIDKEWVGESERVWQGQLDQARARNRRVEMYIDWFDIPPLTANLDNSSSCPSQCTPLKEITDIVALSDHQAVWSRDTEESREANFVLNDATLETLYAATDVTMSSNDNDIAMTAISQTPWIGNDQDMTTALTKELIACGMDPLRVNVLPPPAISLDSEQPSSTLRPYSRYKRSNNN